MNVKKMERHTLTILAPASHADNICMAQWSLRSGQWMLEKIAFTKILMKN